MYWNAVWWIHFHENTDEDNESGKRRCQHLYIQHPCKPMSFHSISDTNSTLKWLTQGAINFGIQTRWLPLQIILRYEKSYIWFLIMDSKTTLLKKGIIFIAHPFKPFPKGQPTYPSLIFFTYDSGYMQQLSGKYCKVPLHRVNWVKTQNKWCQSLIHLVYDCSRWKEAIRTPLLTPSKGRIQSPN